MNRFITFIIATFSFIHVFAYKYDHIFQSTPLSEAIVTISRNHPDINISFIYKDLDLYTTSAHILTDDPLEALRQTIALNPVAITRKENNFYIEALQHGRFICHGKVVDTDNRPIDAIVMLLAADSTLVTYSITEESGEFSIPYDKKRLIAKIHSIGYEQKIIPVPADGVMGTIPLKQSGIALAGVTVTASGIVTRADKNAIYVSKRQKERATDGLNVVSQVSFMCPEIRVNEMLKTITINNQEAILLVNGVKRDISYLNSIDPDRIIKIEFVNFADIRYGAPYIDVKIRQSEKGGFIMLDATADINSRRENYEASGGYNSGNHELTVMYDGTFRNNKKEFIFNQSEYLSPVKEIKLNEIGLPSPVLDREHRIRLVYTAMTSNENMFTATASLCSHNNDKTDLNSVFSNLPDGNYDQDISRRYRYLQPSLDIYFKKEIGADILELNTVGSLLSGNYDRDVSHSTGYREDSHTKNRVANIQAEATLTRQYSEFKLRYGLNYSYNRTDNTSRFTSQNDSKFKEDRQNAYAYINGSGKALSVWYSASMGILYQNLTKNKVSFKGILNLNRQLSDKWSVSYLFSATPDSPSLSSFSPIITPVNSYLYQTGNKDLKSALYLDNRLSARFSHKNFTVSIASLYTAIKNPLITEYRYIDTPDSEVYGNFLAMPANGRNGKSFGFEATSGLNDILSMFFLSLRGGWRGFHFRDSNNEYRHYRWYLGINASAWYRNWSLSVYYTPFLQMRLTGNILSEDVRFSYIMLGYKYRGVTFTLSASNPFSDHGFSQRTQTLSATHPESTFYYIKDQANLLSIGVRYNVNFGRQLKKGNRTLRLGGLDNGLDTNY